MWCRLTNRGPFIIVGKCTDSDDSDEMVKVFQGGYDRSDEQLWSRSYENTLTDIEPVKKSYLPSIENLAWLSFSSAALLIASVALSSLVINTLFMGY